MTHTTLKIILKTGKINNQKLKVGVVLRDFQIGGCQKQVALYLKYIDKKKYDIFLFTSLPENIQKETEQYRFNNLQIKIVRPPQTISNFFASVLWLNKEIRYRKINIILSFQWRSDLIATLINFLGSPLKVIINERGDRALRSVSKVRSRKIIDRLFIVFFSTRCTANSIHGRDILINLGASKNKCTYIPNGIELMENSSKSNIRDNILDNENNSFKFCLVASIKDMKGHRFAIEAVAELMRKTSKNFIVDFIGDGPLRNEIEQLIEDRGVKHKVFMRGERNDIDMLLQSYHCGLMLSESEGFPNVVLEYIRANVPVISTPAGSAIDAFEDKKEILLVKYDDSVGLSLVMEKIMSDSLLRNNLVKNSLKKIKNNFEIRKIVKQYEDLIDEVIKT